MDIQFDPNTILVAKDEIGGLTICF
jgi:hypothetical protein